MFIDDGHYSSSVLRRFKLPPTAGSAGLTIARVVDPSDLRLANSNYTTNTQKLSQSIHPSIHLEKVWGRLKSVNKHGSLTSHCRSLLDSFPPDSSITLWISSSSFSAFVTSSLESFRLQEEHKCADENKMLHTAAKLHQAREAPFAFSAYFCIDNLPGSNLTPLNLT